MNVADTFDSDGQRVAPHALYSPFLRLLHVPKIPKRARSLPIAPKLNWVEIIGQALQSGPCSVQELWNRVKSEKRNKGTFHTILSRMGKEGLIVKYGDQQPFCYGAKPKK
jgi:hypothetical protein